jgi:hypothetical protein
MTTDTPPARSLLQPETAVLALHQALAAARTAGTPAVGQLGAETAMMRRSDLAALVDDIDATVALISEALSNIDGLDDWLPNGQTLLSQALGGLEQTGQALNEIHTGLAPAAR